MDCSKDSKGNRRLAAVLILIFALAVSAFGFIRSSVSYGVEIDECARAGGTSSSAGYAETNAAAGQDLCVGSSTSASYNNSAGVVLAPLGVTRGFLIY